MEQHLANLLQNTLAIRHKKIHDEAQLALDTLDTQKLSLHFKSWQIRGKCLSVMQLALESYNPTLCNIGLGGIEHVVVHPDLDGLAGEEELDAMDCKLFALQVLGALQSLPNLTADQQLCGMKILLNLCCNFVSSFEGDLIINIMQMCLACWHKEKNKVRSAIIQLCAAYTMHTLKFCAETCGQGKVDPGVNCAAESVASQAVERLANADIANCKHNGKLADVIGLAMFFVKQVKLTSKSDSDKGVYLECLLAVLKTLKSEYVIASSMFASYVSKELCPTLAATISLNTVTTKVRMLSIRKRRKMKKQKNAKVTLNGMLHRKVALIAVEVVRLVGSIASLRPHIGLVFSHLLSSIACNKHGIPFNILNKLWSTPEMLFNLAGPFLVQDLDVKQNCTSILQLILDAMLQVCTEKVEVESVSTVTNIRAAIKSLQLLLETLDKSSQDLGFNIKKISVQLQSELDVAKEDESTKENATESPNQTENEKMPKTLAVSSGKLVSQRNDVEVDLSQSDDDVTDDVWVSSEDIFTAMSSPYYQSAAEDEEELNGMKTETSKLYGMMQYIARSKQFHNSTNEMENTDRSTSLETVEHQMLDSDEDVSKVIEKLVLSEFTTGTKTLVGLPEATRDAVLARTFYTSLKMLVPQLLQLNDVASVDQALQKVASQFCSDMYEKWKLDKIVVQAGSLYTLSYSILLLSLRLKLSGHYDNSGAQLPCVKSQWVAYQQSCGVYLSKSWLSETFREVIINDILDNAQCDQTNSDTLITMLGEIDGLGCHSSSHESNVKSTFSISTTSRGATGGEFAKQILVSIWSDLIQVLQCPLLKVLASKDLSSALFQVLSPSSVLDRSKGDRDCIIASLDAMRDCITLSHSLGLYNLTGMVLTPMVEACVPKDYAAKQIENNEDLRLHISPVLFMETLLDVAIDVGKKSQKSWDGLFKVVMYIAYLDHVCFHESSPNVDVKEKLFDCSALHSMSISDLIKENKADSCSSDSSASDELPLTSMGFLTHDRTAKAVYSLSRKVDALFEHAAADLDLRTLTDFLWSLCLSSNRQLCGSETDQDAQILGTPLLYRLGECALSCVRSTRRPLLHITNIWRFAAPHFTKVLGHRNTHFAKQAGTYIYNMVTTVLTYPAESTNQHPAALWSEQEPKYFYFVEELLLPFERAVQSEDCDNEVQGLIIGAICQLVETSSNRICSGWRPLFSALKHITHNQQTMDRSPIFEVLNAFFVASSSPVVLASAAHDCINCLLKLLGNIQDDIIANSTPILSYLETIANTILEVHDSDDLEQFGGLHRVSAEHFLSYDSTVWKSLSTPLWLQHNKQTLGKVAENLDKMTERCFTEQRGSGDEDDSPHVEWTDHTRLFHTWFHLLDGLTLRTLTSPKSLQPSVLDLLCKLLKQSPSNSGFSFSCYVLLHSCLPSLRLFLQRLIDEEAKNIDVISYKHVFGTLMEITATLILKNLQHSCIDATTDKKYQMLNEKLWIAYLNLCITCVQTRKEQLAKLACSCIRHIITVVGKWMTSSMIDDLCSCLNFVMSDCLAAVNALTSLVGQDSRVLDEFIYEERRSPSLFCDASSLTRVFQLATCAQSQKDSIHYEVTISYTSQSANLKVSLCELACDISTLNLILKCVEFMLLGNSLSPWQQPINTQQDNKRIGPNHSGLTSSLHSSNASTKVEEPSSSNQPLLEYLSSTQLHDICYHVTQCFIAARKFDNISSLQQYVQKLARFYSPANLYQFAGASICAYFRLLLAICCRLDPSLQNIGDRRLYSSNFQLTFVPLLDILPLLKEASSCDDVTMSSEALKSNSSAPSWAYTALHKCIVYLCQPWDLEEVAFPPELVEDPPDEGDDGSELSDHHLSSDDSRSLRSLEINLDYMAYVKRTDSIPSPTAKPRLVDNELTEPLKANRPPKKLYRVASDKVVKGFMDAYKRYNKRKQSSDQSHIQEGITEENSEVERRRTLSEKSAAMSSVLALDEQLLKRQAWSSIMESILRLLTSAPDPALSRLLPVIYQPLTSLANHRPLSNPLVVGGSDVGDAFHKWLLRIGQFCNFVPFKSNE